MKIEYKTKTTDNHPGVGRARNARGALKIRRMGTSTDSSLLFSNSYRVVLLCSSGSHGHVGRRQRVPKRVQVDAEV